MAAQHIDIGDLLMLDIHAAPSNEANNDNVDVDAGAVQHIDVPPALDAPAAPRRYAQRSLSHIEHARDVRRIQVRERKLKASEDKVSAATEALQTVRTLMPGAAAMIGDNKKAICVGRLRRQLTPKDCVFFVQGGLH